MKPQGFPQGQHSVETKARLTEVNHLPTERIPTGSKRGRHHEMLSSTIGTDQKMVGMPLRSLEDVALRLFTRCSCRKALHCPLSAPLRFGGQERSDADLTGDFALARARVLSGGGGLRVLSKLGSQMEAVRTLEPGRWWCRAADFGEVQPAHAVLSNGLVVFYFIPRLRMILAKLPPISGMTAPGEGPP